MDTKNRREYHFPCIAYLLWILFCFISIVFFFGYKPEMLCWGWLEQLHAVSPAAVLWWSQVYSMPENPLQHQAIWTFIPHLSVCIWCLLPGSLFAKPNTPPFIQYASLPHPDMSRSGNWFDCFHSTVHSEREFLSCHWSLSDSCSCLRWNYPAANLRVCYSRSALYRMPEMTVSMLVPIECQWCVEYNNLSAWLSLKAPGFKIGV